LHPVQHDVSYAVLISSLHYNQSMQSRNEVNLDHQGHFLSIQDVNVLGQFLYSMQALNVEIQDVNNFGQYLYSSSDDLTLQKGIVKEQVNIRRIAPFQIKP
jgi:hypothetical protein